MTIETKVATATVAPTAVAPASVATAARPRERLADRPRQILDEAAMLIGERGHYGFAIKELAERCGITVAGVLHHFGSKDQILIALLRDRDENDEAEIRALWPAHIDEADATLDQVRRVFHQLVVLNSGQPGFVRLYSMLRTESLYADHPAHAFFNERDARVLALFERFVTAHVTDPRSTARRLMALMGGLEEMWLRDPAGFDLVDEWDRAADLLLPLRPGPRT